jgi:3,4-dihydroxy 2-butanone 4-phosphate synthase / GTP cyclohydrolase II
MLPNGQQKRSTFRRSGGHLSRYDSRREDDPLTDMRDSARDRLQLIAPSTVERVAEARLPTELGEFRLIGYRSRTSDEEFVALVRGEMRGDSPTLVRVHSQCMTGDVFGSTKCDCGRQLRAALELIASEGYGAIVYQQQEGRGIGIINKIRAYALQDEGADTIEANELLGLEVDLRRYDQCAEILLDLGLRRVRVMSNNPVKIQALSQSGLNVLARVCLEVAPTDAASHYLRTKKERMGHLLEMV